MNVMQKKNVAILLIDDNPGDISLMKEKLPGCESVNFIIENRGKLSTGLERLKQGNLDVIILDNALPDSSGIDTFLTVKAQAADIPILILTEFADDPCAVESVQLGAQDYLIKGHTRSDYMKRALLNAIERKKADTALRESKRLNELLLDSLPHPTLLINRERIILAANRIARENGAKVGGYCWRDFAHGEYIPEEHKAYIKKFNKLPPGGTRCSFCLGDESLDNKKAVNNPEVEMSGKLWDIWWIPIEDDVYLHFSIDITERKKAEAALRNSEERLRLIVENMPVMLTAFDGSGYVIAWNSECEKVTGFRAHEVIGSSETTGGISSKGDYNSFLKEQLIKQGGNFRNLELDITGKDGGKKTILWSNMSDIYPIPGWSTWAVGIDISVRKKTEKKLEASLAEKEVLLKEIHHRVKNNLQVINSLLSLQARRINDRESIAIFTECKNRINSISLVHEKLYESKDLANINFGEYIRILSKQLFNLYSTNLRNVSLKMEVENVPLQINKAIPCALIMNELLMNAIKFGFPAGENGEIIVEFKSSGNGTVQLAVIDNGIGLPGDFDIEVSSTLGMQIVNALVRQLHGTIVVAGGKGAKFFIEFPLKSEREGNDG